MFNNLKVGSRLFVLTIFASVVTIGVLLVGLSGMKRIADTTETMYADRVVALDLLGKVSAEFNAVSGDIFRTFQHDPTLPISRLHISHTAAEHLQSADEKIRNIDQLWQAYLATSLTDEEQKLAAAVDKDYNQLVREVLQPTLTALRNGDYSLEVVQNFIAGYRQFGMPMQKDLDDLLTLNERISKESLDEARVIASASLKYMVATFVVGLLLAAFIAWAIIRSVVLPLQGLQATMGAVEQSGDFTRRVDVSGSDEVGQTASSFNQLLTTMQNTLGEILDETNQLDNAATELATIAQQVAQSSGMTSETSSAMAASVEEMTVSINHVAESAQETSKITQHTSELSQQGGEVIHQTIDKMHAMASAVRESSESISELGKHSEQISGIVQVIKDVADQTNLLALNAAIEAARAGEQGRGFAVVADEVRKLAERTTKATGEIGAMIAAIQESSQAAVSAMSHAAEEVESGVTLADHAGTAVTNIQAGSKEVKTCVSEASNALTEQSTASQLIAQQVERVAQAAEQNSAAASGASEAARHIEQLARAMRDSVARFKVCPA